MNIEKLNSAAFAAGFAMAPDEPRDEGKSELLLENTGWQAGDAILHSPPVVTPSRRNAPSWVPVWMRGAIFGVFGRGAPA